MGTDKITSWAPIVGRWHLGDGKIVRFQGLDDSRIPFGICVSNARLTEGDVTATVKLPESNPNWSEPPSGRIILGYQSPQSEYVLAGLGGYNAAFSISIYDNAKGWQALAKAGDASFLHAGVPYRLRVKVQGQRISLSVDDVQVLETLLPKPVNFGQLGLFAWERGQVEFSNITASAKRGSAFVVMQFTGFEDLYADVIKPVVTEFGLDPYRADEVFGPGQILQDIIRGLEDSKIVIAEITPVNQNVFYELGYAHALKKPTILLAEKGKQLPFDITGYRCLFYDNTIGGKKKVEDGLRKHLSAILHM